jgi:hypothetical protein
MNRVSGIFGVADYEFLKFHFDVEAAPQKFSGRPNKSVSDETNKLQPKM